MHSLPGARTEDKNLLLTQLMTSWESGPCDRKALFVSDVWGHDSRRAVQSVPLCDKTEDFDIFSLCVCNPAWPEWLALSTLLAQPRPCSTPQLRYVRWKDWPDSEQTSLSSYHHPKRSWTIFQCSVGAVYDNWLPGKETLTRKRPEPCLGAVTVTLSHRHQQPQSGLQITARLLQPERNIFMRNILTCPEMELVRDNYLVVGMFRVKINVNKTSSSVSDSPARLVLFI